MIGHEFKKYGFDRLFEAVVYFPENVPALVKENPEILNCTNYAGETVLEFFSMEGRDDIVQLLLDMGAKADEWAIYFACGPCQISVIAILLAHGVIPDCEACSRELKTWNVPRNKRIQLKRIFHGHGFNLEI